MTDILTVEKLGAGYGQLKVLHSVDLSIRRDSVTAIVGPNGHGKTTLLRAIAGLLPAWTGRVAFDGRTLQCDAPERARMGLTLVPQGDQLFTGMTVEENLFMGAFTQSDRGIVQDELANVYDLFPRLKERRSQKTESLSGGERRMVGIGRGMMARGRLMMIDEPSLGLAPLIIEQIYAALGALAATGRSIVVVEENPSRVMNVASRFHLMDGGRIVWEGTAETLASSDDVLTTYLGGH